MAQIEADPADMSWVLGALADEDAARPHRLGDWSARA